MKSYNLTKGHNLIIEGAPLQKIIDINNNQSILVHPSSIKNIKIKPLVKEGDAVQIGSPLFFDKKDEKVIFVSPCSGTINKISLGPRRIVDTIEIVNDNKNDHEILNKEIF